MNVVNGYAASAMPSRMAATVSTLTLAPPRPRRTVRSSRASAMRCARSSVSAMARRLLLLPLRRLLRRLLAHDVREGADAAGAGGARLSDRGLAVRALDGEREDGMVRGCRHDASSSHDSCAGSGVSSDFLTSRS